jgi:hypothetical protein
VDAEMEPTLPGSDAFFAAARLETMAMVMISHPSLLDNSHLVTKIPFCTFFFAVGWSGTFVKFENN